MRLSSLRLTLLSLIARLLRRWLTAVTAQLESAPPEPDRMPPAPDHWVELVRQRAPQLLEPDAPGVIDYRAAAPPQAAPTPPARPLPQRTAQRRASPLKAAARRPLRLERVSARALSAHEVEVRAPQGDAAQIDPLTVTPAARPPEPLQPRQSAPLNAQSEARPQPASESEPLPLAPHFADLPFERTRIRETRAALPDAAAHVPTVRTRAGGGAPPRQARPRVPESPPQVVLRPTVIEPPLDLDGMSSDRWPTLPDPPAEERRDPSVERQRRERLIREQEGRAWSE